MNYKMLLAVFLFLVLIAMAYAQHKGVFETNFDKKLQAMLSHSVKEVLPSDINNSSAILFLDSRELKEFEVSCLPDARWVGYKDFNLTRLAGIDKNQQIVVYCSVGYRSERIAEKLVKNGYSNVSNLYGGIFAWVNEGNKVYDSLGPTSNVHTFNKNWSKWLKKGNKTY